MNYVIILTQALETAIRKEVDDAVKVAKADKEIGPHELPGDIYVENLEGDIRNVTPWVPLKHVRVGPAVNA